MRLAATAIRRLSATTTTQGVSSTSSALPEYATVRQDTDPVLSRDVLYARNVSFYTNIII